jgi:hypothetical protein
MSQPKSRRITVRKPSWPSVNVKASASGTPAKLAATPENVMRAERRIRGSPPRMTAYASRSPKMPPATAVTRLTSIVVRKAPGMMPVERSA